MSVAREIDVGNDFYFRLANRNKYQGDGKHNAQDFRKQYMLSPDNEEAWKNDMVSVVFNFEKVKKIGPSFANEAFAYFMKYSNPGTFRKKVSFKNISKVQKMIIDKELQSGYSR